MDIFDEYLEKIGCIIPKFNFIAVGFLQDMPNYPIHTKRRRQLENELMVLGKQLTMLYDTNNSKSKIDCNHIYRIDVCFQYLVVNQSIVCFVKAYRLAV